MPEEQNADYLRASGNKKHGCRNTGVEMLPEVNYFCTQRLPYHKTQYEDILVRYQGAFSTHTGLPKHQNVSDKPIIWQRNEVFKSEPPIVAADVRSKKTTDDVCVKHHRDQSSGIRFGTMDISVYFNAKVDYT